jgi:tetratricopeptide (TPR) repeat protein
MRVLTTGIVLGVLAAACGGEIDRDYYLRMDQALAAGEASEASELVQEAGRRLYGDRNRLLYHMDLGLALQLAGDYAGSAAQFEQAEALGEDLYTRSLGNEAASLFSNDMMMPYAGEEFERVLVNLFNAMNFAVRGEVDEALVEVRRVAVKFDTYAREGDGRYRADPLALYLSGLLYEQVGSTDDARIALERALELYEQKESEYFVPVPPGLRRDLRRVQEQRPMVRTAGHGQLIVLHYVGPGPRKRENVFEVSLGQGLVVVQQSDVRGEDEKQVQRALSAAKGMALGTQVTVAYPVFEQPPMAASRAFVEVEGCGGAWGRPVESVSRIAQVNLEDRMGRMWSRVVARAVLKFVTARAAGVVGERLSGQAGVGFLVQAMANAALSATEAADVRGWRTLPAEIHMTRLVCPAGAYTVRTSHTGGTGCAGQEFQSVKVGDGTRTWLVAACY